MPAPISEIDSALSYMSISKLFAFESVPKAADNVSPPMPAPLPFRDYQKIFKLASSDSRDKHTLWRREVVDCVCIVRSLPSLWQITC